MFGLGIGELVVIGLFALLFIGPKKLPELAKGLGKGIREFQRAKDEIVKSVKDPDYGTEEDKQKHIASHGNSEILDSTASLAENDTHKEEEQTNDSDLVESFDLSEVQPPKLASIARGDLDPASEVDLKDDEAVSEDKGPSKS